MSPMHKEKKKRSRAWLRYGLALLVMLLSTVIVSAVAWFDQTFNLTFEGLMFTLQSPTKGADVGFLLKLLPLLLPNLMVFAAAAAVLLLTRFVLLRRQELLLRIRLWKGKSWRIPVSALLCWCMVLLFVAPAAISLGGEIQRMDIDGYYRSLNDQTTIYEEYYVEPTQEIISAPAEKKNLLLIYLESMETTYASVEDGGYQTENYMPELTELARENLSFSDSELLGGAHCTAGTGWTIASLFATTSGLPLRFPGVNNTMDLHTEFASGVTSLGDILAEQGYQQEFLCGSQGNFAGRADYYDQHGGALVYDYDSAVANGDIPVDHYVWWGYEDYYLYEIAQKELTRLAAEDEPFCLSMLTVDTHHVGGYVCPLCGDEYENSTANVVRCADRQVCAFLDWCREQDFYENTVIVVMGDHPRMDSELVGDLRVYDRTIYNAFLNVDEALLQNARTTNRSYAPMDLFPTILAALGYEIDGERLGMGTNLFSARDTLCEELGYDAYNSELAKYSQYFVDQFS